MVSSEDHFDCFLNARHCDDYCCVNLLEISNISNSISAHAAIVGFRKKRCIVVSAALPSKEQSPRGWLPELQKIANASGKDF